MIPFVLLIVVSVIVVATQMWPRMWGALRFRGSNSWPTFSAIVEQGIVHTYSGRSSRTFRAELIYSYQVGGEYYSGRYVGDLSFSEAEVEDFVAQFPKGALLQVHVHPGRPDLSVLRF
jgi:hypothetical protein